MRHLKAGRDIIIYNTRNRNKYFSSIVELRI